MITLFLSLLITTGFSQSEALQLHFELGASNPYVHSDMHSYGDHIISGGLTIDASQGALIPWVARYSDQGFEWIEQLSSGNDTQWISLNVAELATSPDVIVCITGSPSIQTPYIRVMRLDGTNGSLIWSKELRYPSDSSPQDVKNQLFITAQDEIVATSSYYNYLLVTRLDADGNVLFSKKANTQAGGGTMNAGYGFMPVSDGGYLSTFNEGSDKAVVVKLHPDLSLEWSRSWNVEPYIVPKAFTELDNGTFLVSGTLDTGSFLAMVSPQGELSHYYQLKPQVDTASPQNAFGIQQLKQLDANRVFGYAYLNAFILDLQSLTSTEYWQLADAAGNQTLYWEYDLQDAGIHCYQHYTDPEYIPIITDFDPLAPYCVSPTAYTNAFVERTISSQSDTSFYLVDAGTEMAYLPVVIPGQGTVQVNCVLAITEEQLNEAIVFPNPALSEGTITVELSGQPQPGERLALLDLSGKVRQTVELSTASTTMQLDHSLAAGMYLLHHTDHTGKLLSIGKLVIE